MEITIIKTMEQINGQKDAKCQYFLVVIKIYWHMSSTKSLKMMKCAIKLYHHKGFILNTSNLSIKTNNGI